MPALLIPIFTIIGTLTLGKMKWGNVSLVDPDKVTLVALALGALLAFVAAMRITKSKNNNACTRRKQTITSCRLGCYFTTNVSGTWRYFREVWRWTSRFWI